MTSPTVVIHGPAGSGKTACADEFCKYFGCTHVEDGFDTSNKLVPGALHLTNIPSEADANSTVVVMSIDEALARLRGT